MSLRSAGFEWYVSAVLHSHLDIVPSHTELFAIIFVRHITSHPRLLTVGHVVMKRTDTGRSTHWAECYIVTVATQTTVRRHFIARGVPIRLLVTSPSCTSSRLERKTEQLSWTLVGRTISGLGFMPASWRTAVCTLVHICRLKHDLAHLNAVEPMSNNASNADLPRGRTHISR